MGVIYVCIFGINISYYLKAIKNSALYYSCVERSLWLIELWFENISRWILWCQTRVSLEDYIQFWRRRLVFVNSTFHLIDNKAMFAVTIYFYVPLNYNTFGQLSLARIAILYHVSLFWIIQWHDCVFVYWGLYMFRIFAFYRTLME